MDRTNKIGTHNSVTGEKSYGIISKLVAPFSICQSKTISEQLRAGVTYFDIRIRKTKRGVICAHGLWESKKSADDILSQLNQVASKKNIYVRLVYENAFKYKNTKYTDMVDVLYECTLRFKNIKFVGAYIKQPYQIVVAGEEIAKVEAYPPIYKGHKELYFPIPWFWAKLDKWLGHSFYGGANVANNVYTIKDFL